MKNISYDSTKGFGLRAIAGEARGFAHSGEISESSLKRASETVKSVSKNYSGIMARQQLTELTGLFIHL